MKGQRLWRISSRVLMGDGGHFKQDTSTREAEEARGTGEDRPSSADLDSFISHNSLISCATNTGGKRLSFLNITSADNFLTFLTRLPLCLDPLPSPRLSSVNSYTKALDYKLLCGQQPTHLCVLSTRDQATGGCETAGWTNSPAELPGWTSSCKWVRNNGAKKVGQELRILKPLQGTQFFRILLQTLY